MMKDNNTERELDNPQVEKKIKKAVNDISADTEVIKKCVESISLELPVLAATREDVNDVITLLNQYIEKLDDATDVINKGVNVSVSPVQLSEKHTNTLDLINTNLEARNKRWATLCKAVASKGKMKVVLTAVFSVLLTVACMLLVYDNSPLVWAHRAFVAAESLHLDDPAAEYSKAYIEMGGSRQARKSCKQRIEGMESMAVWEEQKDRGSEE